MSTSETMHRLTMISGVAGCNDMIVGAFVLPEHAKLTGDHLLRLDRQQHTDWARYIIEPIPAIDVLIAKRVPVGEAA